MTFKIFICALLMLSGFQIVLAQKDQGFALYLLPANIDSRNLAKLDLKKIKPQGPPFITIESIWSYLKDTHEIVLSYDAGLRLKKLRVPVSGRPFVVFAEGEPIYIGAFWTSLSSISFNGITIGVSDLRGDFPVLKLALGYPPSDTKHTLSDPRADPRIFRALEKRGVLREQVWMYGKCKHIHSTGKRRNSYVFTFDVTSVIKSNYDLPDVVFEIFDDVGNSLRSLVEAEWEERTQLSEKWHFNSQKEILLKFDRRVADKPGKVHLVGFEAKGFGR